MKRMLHKDMKAFTYKLQTVHKLEADDYDHRVEVYETLFNLYENGSVIRLFFIYLEE